MFSSGASLPQIGVVYFIGLLESPSSAFGFLLSMGPELQTEHLDA